MTRSECLNERMCSFNALEEWIDGEREEVISDKGACVERIVDWIDRRDAGDPDPWLSRQNIMAVRLAIFEYCLVAGGHAKLLPILRLIVRNGSNRQESIAQLQVAYGLKRHASERKYHRGVNLMLRLISPNKIKGFEHTEKGVCP